MSVFRSASVKQKNGITLYLVVVVMLLSVFIPILLVLRYSASPAPPTSTHSRLD